VNQLVFSSTAAVYGEPDQVPVREDAPTRPINPYGRSKLMGEWMIQDFAKASPLRYVILRYFNVAGANRSGKLGQRSHNATHLIQMACDTVLGKRSQLEIYGTDYPTPDGSAIRDFIHVDDLASAHLAALRYLESGKKSETLNCGYGRGYSVREVIQCIQSVSKKNLSIIEVKRRMGDPACVTACACKITAILGWVPEHDNLDLIIRDALNWESFKLEESRQKCLLAIG
jgi:UDP-glucose 4-epimerase